MKVEDIASQLPDKPKKRTVFLEHSLPTRKTSHPPVGWGPHLENCFFLVIQRFILPQWMTTRNLHPSKHETFESEYASIYLVSRYKKEMYWQNEYLFSEDKGTYIHWPRENLRIPYRTTHKMHQSVFKCPLTHKSWKHHLLSLATYSQHNQDKGWNPLQRAQSWLPWVVHQLPGDATAISGLCSMTHHCLLTGACSDASHRMLQSVSLIVGPQKMLDK